MPLASIGDFNKYPEEIVMRVKQAKQLSMMYDDFLLLEQEEEVDDGSRPPGLHASELYPCLRKPYYSLINMEKRKRVSKFWLQRFKVGHSIHALLQSDFARLARRTFQQKAMFLASSRADDMNCYLEFEAEVEVGPSYQPLAAYYQMFSHCDGIFTFRDKTTDEVVLRVGLEIKTESPDQYAALKGPKEEHLRQAHVYMAALDLPIMWFFYMNKGNQNNTNSEAPYLVTWQPDIWEEIQARMLWLHEQVKLQELPPRTETIMCEFCPWSWTCEPKNVNQAPPMRATTRREMVRKPGG